MRGLQVVMDQIQKSAEIVFDVVKVELPKLSAAFIAFLHLFPQHEVEEALQNEYYKH